MLTKKQNQISVRTLTSTAILAALSSVLMYLEFAVPFVPEFLKYDFSDLPALIAAFSLGPTAGVAVEFIKNLIHLPMTATSGVGELANFLIGAAFVLPAGIVYRYSKNRKGAIIGSLIGMVASALISLPVNYFITYPFYAKLLPMDVILSLYQALNPKATTLWRALLMFNLPFTAIKGAVNVLITLVVYKKITPLLRGKNKS